MTPKKDMLSEKGEETVLAMAKASAASWGPPAMVDKPDEYWMRLSSGERECHLRAMRRAYRAAERKHGIPRAEPQPRGPKSGSPVARGRPLPKSTVDSVTEGSGAPACDVCGTITVRSGTLHKCVNCGNAMQIDADRRGDGDPGAAVPGGGGT